MYEKIGDKLQVNSFKCMDMAGSERIIKSGVDPNSIEGFQCGYVNFSITEFARILFNLKRQKTITGGEPLPTGCSWKLLPIT